MLRIEPLYLVVQPVAYVTRLPYRGSFTDIFCSNLIMSDLSFILRSEYLLEHMKKKPERERDSIYIFVLLPCKNPVYFF